MAAARVKYANKSDEVAIDQRAGAEIVYGGEACHKHSLELLEELGFPKGVLPLQDLVECGRVRETGFVWMKAKAPYEHFFATTNTRVSYSTEVTAYVEKSKMKKMSGVKSKQLLLWVPIVEMSLIDNKKIYFKTPMGIGKSFAATAFMDEEEKHKYLHAGKN
ncbi:Embryogenesis-associated protein EMB8 [Heracleum sosnowskyi]|uniref:Embryogenesis-associated protein EMB8 n=1 Tax=Heracleum sosnowskyi TaxID=360622 RepID=A0AAD8MRS0_9APIA|nr:Embryogenesis-associated protein EMB8 [Heracleum sosnowskyi]